MKRETEWKMFSQFVKYHIRDYAVAQYGDSPGDKLSDYSPEDCMREIKKYVERHFRGQRGEEETRRDLFKIAHYAAVCWNKERMKREPEPRKVGRIEEGEQVQIVGVHSSDAYFMGKRDMKGMVGRIVKREVAALPGYFTGRIRFADFDRYFHAVRIRRVQGGE